MSRVRWSSQFDTNGGGRPRAPRAMSRPAQSFESHAKLVPLYHYWTGSMILFPTLYFAYRMIVDFSMDSFALFVFGAGAVLATFFARVFPLGVQDRVIRLEEHLRMERIFPDDLRARIDDFTTDQLIGMRFASDEELADLARRVLDGAIKDRKGIKQAVTSWRADNQRI